MTKEEKSMLDALWQLGGSESRMPNHEFMDAFGLQVFTSLHRRGWMSFDLSDVFITESGREALKGYSP